MKRHLTLTTTSQYASRHVPAAAESAVGRLDSDSYITLSVDGTGWRHTLILTGRLDYFSAAELEDEIECLRQEGVTALTLDLRQLDGIDSRGAQVIAFQSALFKQGGRRFTVIPGALLRHGLLAQARVRSLAANASGERIVRRFSNPRAQGILPARSTTMMKHLIPYSQAEGG